MIAERIVEMNRFISKIKDLDKRRLAALFGAVLFCCTLLLPVNVAAAETEPEPEESVIAAEDDRSEQKTAAEALAVIYADAANVPRQNLDRTGKFIRAGRLKDILEGKYTPNAAAVFLDHGYYTDHIEELRDAGMLPEGYELPQNCYFAIRTQELERYPLPEDAFCTYVILTDSPYLQTFQLCTIAEYHGFVEYSDYVSELKSYEDLYVSKHEWEQCLLSDNSAD